MKNGGGVEVLTRVGLVVAVVTEKFGKTPVPLVAGGAEGVFQSRQGDRPDKGRVVIG